MRGNQSALHIPEISVILLALTSLMFTRITGQRMDDAHMDGNSLMERIHPRIVGGSPAAQEDTKYMAFIYEKDGWLQYCMGALISPNVVLSTANLIYDLKPSDLIVVMGTMDQSDKTNIFKLKELVKHPKFTKDNLYPNIALLFLASSVKKNNKNIKPIKINRKPIEDNTKCKVFGLAGLFESSLLTVDIEATTLATCKKSPEADVLKDYLKPGILCAGDGTKGAGAFDNAALLVCNDVLVGILSGASTEENVPSLYSDINHYKNWIDKEMKKPGRKSGSDKVAFTLILMIGSVFGCWV